MDPEPSEAIRGRVVGHPSINNVNRRAPGIYGQKSSSIKTKRRGSWPDYQRDGVGRLIRLAARERTPEKSARCATLSALSPSVIQTNPVLRLIVLITESIFPLKTCLARLRVKPVTVRKGRCDGNDKA